MDFTSPAPPIAWQSIRDANGMQVGHEIFNRSRTASTHTIDSDLSLAHSVLSHLKPAALLDDGLLFLNTTYESLRSPHLDLLPTDKVVLEIPSLGHAASSEVEARRPALAALRDKGFALAFNHSVLDSAYAPWHDLVNYLKIDFSVLAAERAVLMIRWGRRIPGVTLIADKIESAAQLQLAQENQVDLLQGYAVRRPEPVPARVVLPTVREARALRVQLKANAEPEALTQFLQAQPTLLFNLLRLAQSQELSKRHIYTSLPQLLASLRVEQLHAWAGMLDAVAQNNEPRPPDCIALYQEHAMALTAAAATAWPDVPHDSLVLIAHSLLLGKQLGLTLQQAVDQLLPPPLATPVLALESQWQDLLQTYTSPD